MDAGITSNFKAKYRSLHVRHQVDQADKGNAVGKLNIKEAIEFAVHAWNNVQPSTIANRWRKTGILPNVDCAVVEAEVQRVARDAEVGSLIS